MLAKHYAPRTQTILVNDLSDLAKIISNKRVGLLLLKREDNLEGFAHIEELSPTADLTEATANLYMALHVLDSLKLDLIVAVRMPEQGLGRSINDRLERAASS